MLIFFDVAQAQNLILRTSVQEQTIMKPIRQGIQGIQDQISIAVEIPAEFHLIKHWIVCLTHKESEE